MAWRSLVVAVDAGTAEALSDALMDAGALSVSVEDADAGTAAERPIFGEPGAAADRVWDTSVLRALVPEDAAPEALLAEACAAIGVPPPPHRLEDVPDDDWVRKTQAQFDPIRVSDRLWIVPTWHTPPDAGAINLVLDPGLAFGTGSHPTTQLCLRWLEAVIAGGESVLDYGCGSGILAIAAAKLGAGRVIGVDIDAEAVRAARDNAARNDVTAEFSASDGAVPPACDIVVANILANPLKVLAPALARLVLPGGRIALAGLLDEQADDVAAAYAAWFAMAPFARQDGWTCLAGVRQ